MRAYSKKRRPIATGIRRRRHYIRQPIGSEQQAQLAEIRTILRSSDAQAMLTVGQPNDKYEQRADRVSDRVIQMSNVDVARPGSRGQFNRC
jgi:hypothetical protein